MRHWFTRRPRGKAIDSIKAPDALRLFAGVLFTALALHTSAALAQGLTITTTHLDNDAFGNLILATDEQGAVLWRERYQPYGAKRINQASQTNPVNLANPQDRTANNIGFHGKEADAATGLSYFGARYYDPVAGRFMGTDAVRFDPANPHSFNRYAYGNGNPYKYKDPDGKWAIPLLVGVAAWIGMEAFMPSPPVAYNSGIVHSGTLPDGSSLLKGVAVLGGVAKATASGATKETSVVQRWMSKAELEATKDTGLLRGGREGTHHVTDAASADPLRARQRLALDRTPEVRATLEVPSSALSAPSKVNPKFNMPGGGMERTATGNVPARVIGAD